jgi:zeta-carotene desaturase
MVRVLVAGGGLAGIAAAAALTKVGYSVEIFESRPFLGGRATSYPLPSDGPSEVIDNCQHVLIGACVNLLDLYQRLGVSGKIHFFDEFYFLEPGGRMSVMRAGSLPAPAHFAASFMRMSCLNLREKFAIGKAMLALQREYAVRKDLDRITMLDWLREKHQPPRAIERFWRQVLVSAINEELDRMAASHGFQVFHLGFLTGAKASRMGIPAVPLGELYSTSVINQRTRAAVDRIVVEDGVTRGFVSNCEMHAADAVVCAVPFERVNALVPELECDFTGWEHSPITGIHLWFDRSVTTLPHATLLDRTIQWFFNKDGGRYLQLVVSASRSLMNMGKQEVIALALKELTEYLPSVADAKLEKAHVVKEARATFAAAPGMENRRPFASTRVQGLYLAGDWTRTGWPATMEGAVRSGYLAAEAVTAQFGARQCFVIE